MGYFAVTRVPSCARENLAMMAEKDSTLDSTSQPSTALLGGQQNSKRCRSARSYHRSLTELLEVGKKHFPDLEFCLNHADLGEKFLVCSRKELHNHPPLGMIQRVKILVCEDGNYDFQVTFCSKEKGVITDDSDFRKLCENIAVNSSFKFCPGINVDLYDEKYFSVIRYDLKNVRRMVHPIVRIDSIRCLLWHQLSKNASIFEKSMSTVLCSSCKRLRSDLDQTLVRMVTVSPGEKENRLKPSSHFPEKYLSPQSLKKKRKNVNHERALNKRLLEKYESMDVTLNEEQHDEMCSFIEQVNGVGSKGLEELLVEGDKEGVGEAIRNIWKNDLQNIKKEFHRDQSNG